jgi:hypothetical protein
LESYDEFSDVNFLRIQEERRRSFKAHENARTARLVMGALTGMSGLFAMLVSLMPTNYDWDSAMPDYSDVNMVTITTVASGFAVILVVAAAALLWRSRVLVLVLSLLLAVDIYRFITLLPHYEG